MRVAKIYGAKLVFKNVSCAFAKGSVSLLAGGNGAGKSTLLRIMAGLSRPTAGTVTPPGGAVGYLGHATFLYPGLTALENLAFWCDAHGLGLSSARLMEGLARVRLEAHAHERAGVFSRGMAQRLSLARVLLQEPEVLLLDEPGAGLDIPSRILLRQEIAQARQRGACVVLISHDLGEDTALADRLLVLKDRGLAYDGPPGDFRDGATEVCEVGSVLPAGDTPGATVCCA